MEREPALALMYPNHGFFAVVSAFILVESNISDVHTVLSYLEASCRPVFLQFIQAAR